MQGSRDVTVSNKLPVNSSVFSSTSNPYSVVTLVINRLLWGFGHDSWVASLRSRPRLKFVSLDLPPLRTDQLFFSFQNTVISSSSLCPYVFTNFNTSLSSLWDLGRKQSYAYVFDPPSLTGSLQNFYVRGSLKYT